MFKERVNLDELGPVKLMKIFNENKQLEEYIINDIFHHLMDLLYFEPNVYCLNSPIVVVGNIYAQLFDLFKLFKNASDDFENATSEPTKLENTYLFLGNYVDRGYYSVETIVFLALLKIKYPHQIFLLRGFHETSYVNNTYGLFNSCLNLYSNPGIWYLINDAFDLLPIAAVIDKKIFCVHSGLSPKINFIGQINLLNRRKYEFDSPFEDLLNSCPLDSITKFESQVKDPSYFFGKNQTLSFLYNNGLVKRNDDKKHGFIVRSHNVVNNGFMWLHDGYILSIFSAPKFLNNNNTAAFVKIKTDGFPYIALFNEDERSIVKQFNDCIDYYIY